MSIPLVIAQNVLSNVPVQGDVLDDNGNLTQAWRLFMQGLYIRVGGPLAPTNASLGAFSVTNQTNVTALSATSDANAITVSGLSTTSAANATTVANLTTTTNANTTATNANTASIAAINATLSAAPATVVPVAVGASPFTYKATVKGAIAVSGGTVQSLQLTRDGTTLYNVGFLDGIVAMSTNDRVVVTYTAAPVMTFFPT